jgi:hypothetical protein
MNQTTHTSASMKRFSWKPLLLLLFFVLPIATSYLYLQQEKYRVKKTVKRMIINGMEEEKLIAFTFSSRDSAEILRWKHSREFEYQGQMYDIVRYQYLGDSTQYICWHDREESFLNDQIANLLPAVFGHNPGTKQAKSKLAHFYTGLFFQPISTSFVALGYFELFPKGYYDNSQSLIQQIPDPPPELYT